MKPKIHIHDRLSSLLRKFYKLKFYQDRITTVRKLSGMDLHSIKALFLDMDGVLWHGKNPIGDLPSIFHKFQKIGIIRFSERIIPRAH
jgi:hypothetical protein